MARSRNIKPGFFKNEELVELPYETRLLFIGLWTIADRKGRLEDRPKRIKMELFAADNLDTDACLNQLQDAGFILRYERDGARYIQVINFDKHQNPHKAEQPSSVPAPEGYEENPEPSKQSTAQAPDMHGATTEVAGLDSLIPDSLNSDSLIPDSSVVSAADATDPADEPEDITPPAETKPMPRNGAAQTMLAVLYEDILKIGPPTDYGRAAKKAHDLIRAGCTITEMQEIAAWMLRDPWHADKGVTIYTLADARDKYRSSRSQPANMTRVSAPATRSSGFAGKVGKDGLTDEERGWREDPGVKGWSADEMMRRALATERAEAERNIA